MKNQDEMLEALEAEGIIKRNGDLWEAGPKYESLLRPVPMNLTEPTYKMQSKAFSEGLTEERDIEIKESLLTMQVRFLKHGKKWTLQRLGAGKDVEHILLSTQPVKNAQFSYHPPPLTKEK